MGKFADDPFYKIGMGERVYKKRENEPKWKKGLNELMVDYEVCLICLALEQSSGNVALAGRIMGINRTTLWEKMLKFGINRYGYTSS